MNTRTTGSTRLDKKPRLTRFDLLLLLLPLPLVLGVGAASLTAAPLFLGVSLGGVPSAVLLFYGLFIGGPTVPESNQH